MYCGMKHVTIVVIRLLILDVCVSKQKNPTMHLKIKILNI